MSRKPQLKHNLSNQLIPINNLGNLNISHQNVSMQPANSNRSHSHNRLMPIEIVTKARANAITPRGALRLRKSYDKHVKNLTFKMPKEDEPVDTTITQEKLKNSLKKLRKKLEEKFVINIERKYVSTTVYPSDFNH